MPDDQDAHGDPAPPEPPAPDPAAPEPSAPQDPLADLPQPAWDIVEKGGRPDDYETREYPHER